MITFLGSERACPHSDLHYKGDGFEASATCRAVLCYVTKLRRIAGAR